MNKVILMGRLTRDPDIRYSQSDNPVAVARFILAVNRRFTKEGDAQTADFVSCVAFGKTAEFMEKYTRQGTKLVVEGRIQTGNYTDRDGKRVYTTDVIVESVEFAESKSHSTGSDDGSQVTRPEPATAAVDEDGFMYIPDGVEDEGVPFN